MSRNDGSKRLNSKQEVDNKFGLTMIATFLVWLFFLLDMIFVAHNSVFIIIVMTIGIWAVGLSISKPGKFATSVQRNGFWKALLGNGTNQVRRQRNR